MCIRDRAENDWGLSRSSSATSTTRTGSTTRSRATRSARNGSTSRGCTTSATAARTGSCATSTSSGRTGSCASTARCARSERSNGSEPSGATAAAYSHAPDITLAHRSVPGGLDLARVVECYSAVDDDEGIGDTADRAVLVVEHRALIAPIAVIIVAPPILHRRKIHRLGVVELRALHGVVGAHSEAGKQQVRDRSRLAGGVVLEVHERDIVQFC